MDEYEDLETTVSILPGVDVALWLRLITGMLLIVVAVVIALLVA